MTWRVILKGVASAGLGLLPTLVLAQGFNQQLPPFQGTPGGNDLIGAIQNIINFLLVLAAIVAAIYLIYGGVKYIISAGDETKAGEAKNTILYALIGLIVIGLAVVVVNFVLTAISSAA